MTIKKYTSFRSLWLLLLLACTDCLWEELTTKSSFLFLDATVASSQYCGRSWGTFLHRDRLLLSRARGSSVREEWWLLLEVNIQRFWVHGRQSLRLFDGRRRLIQVVCGWAKDRQGATRRHWCGRVEWVALHCNWNVSFTIPYLQETIKI